MPRFLGFVILVFGLKAAKACFHSISSETERANWLEEEESISAYSSTNSILLTFISGACCLIRKRAFDPRSLAKKAERWRLPRPFQNDTFFLRSVDIITYHCKRLNKYLSAKEHMGGGRGDKNRDKMSITTAQGFLVEDGNEEEGENCSSHHHQPPKIICCQFFGLQRVAEWLLT